MEPPLIFPYATISLINSFVDIFGEKKYLTTNYLIFLKKKKGGLKIPRKKALTLQLQGGSPSNMDQYTLEQFCTKFSAFITM